MTFIAFILVFALGVFLGGVGATMALGDVEEANRHLKGNNR